MDGFFGPSPRSLTFLAMSTLTSFPAISACDLALRFSRAGSISSSGF